ncbi:MAG: Holliday junction resolvase RuvX [Chloroflexi bacterium]|nr:Holliday junction resolvase RuvX [Chloroflexota bacterium]
MRVLAVDPGEKRLGIALSDETCTIANPLRVLTHISRADNAEKIVGLANEHDASLIIVGQAIGLDGQPTHQGRGAARLAAAIRTQTELPVELWDESGSTKAAQSARIQLGSTRKKRRGHLDELAATVILQSYLDARKEK